MLVADSSHAHFHRASNTHKPAAADAELRSGCDVVSPADCPATIRGRTLIFPSSRALNACPYLKGRESGELSAACIPVSITGQASAVVHATGPDGIPPVESDVEYIESTARRGSERIAMLRAFEKSEAQARTDPLTGLWNRRSLENRALELHRDGTEYVVAYGDLDHFKVLNDTHGHEAGDQALRLFSRVLRDSIRPTDVTARYGGEEFVVVLPQTSMEAARKILERLRERLALTLGAGRVPAFTVSFGLASSLEANTFDGVVAVADQALLLAKSTGRNRTVAAGDELVPMTSGPMTPGPVT
jgi:diguanylate cyclase (GGDEF)-like protein